jgi:pimeloyl-ACP methyl ester carboxylesterase
MMAGLSRLIDRTAIYFAAARMPRPDGRDPRLTEAQQVIDSPDFIPAEVEAAKVQFTGAVGFRFETPRPGAFAENNTVHGRLYRCAERWQERPTVLLLHGWNDAINHYFRFPFLAAQFGRHGFNAATLEAPFHFQRRPRQLGAWSNFLCPDILRTVEAARQAVAETRSFAAWLRQQGCPAVGLLGVSLGGWLAGLAVCHDARFSCAVLLVPAARLDRLLEEAAFCRGIRLAWKGRRVIVGKLNLTEGRPALPRQNILLIEAVHDLFVPVETMEELWRAWEQPEIWRLRHGHISVLAAPGLHGRIIRWMAPRLSAHAAK